SKPKEAACSVGRDEAWMDADRQILLGGEAAQEPKELLAISLLKRCGELSLVVHGEPGGVAQPGPGRGREVQRVGAPVVGIAPSFHELPVFELVDDGDHAAGRDPERLSERLL